MLAGAVYRLSSMGTLSGPFLSVALDTTHKTGILAFYCSRLKHGPAQLLYNTPAQIPQHSPAQALAGSIHFPSPL